jgi:hypothetical protein
MAGMGRKLPLATRGESAQLVQVCGVSRVVGCHSFYSRKHAGNTRADAEITEISEIARM